MEKQIEWFDRSGVSVASVGPFIVKLHQSRDDAKWWLICPPVIGGHVELASTNRDLAKCQALAKIQVVLESAIETIITH